MSPTEPPAAERRKSIDLTVAAIVLGIFVLLAAPALWIAVQTPFGLIDDIDDARHVDILSVRGFGRFLADNFTASSLVRFRWSWQLYQAGSWLVFGARPALHHGLTFVTRIATCVLALGLLRVLLKSPHPFAYLAVIAYGFFFPIVPEARLGPQETQLTPLLLLCLAWICRLVIRKKGDLASEPWYSCLAFLACFLLLSGSKETALPVLLLLVAFLIGCQWVHRKAHVWLTPALCVIVAVTFWRSLVVLQTSRYVAGDIMLPAGTARYSFYQLRQFTKLFILLDWWRSWLFVTCLAAVAAFLWDTGARIRSGEGRAELVTRGLLILVAGGLAVTMARVSVVPRYVYPLVWLAAILLGTGVHVLLSFPRLPAPCKYAIPLALVLMSLAHWPQFLQRFATQKTVHDNEAALLAHLGERIGTDPGVKMYIDNSAKPGAHLNEFATSIQTYFREFRPRYYGASPVDVAEWSDDNESHRPTSALIITQGRASQVPGATSVHLFKPELSDDSTATRLALALSGLGLTRTNHAEFLGPSPGALEPDIRNLWSVTETGRSESSTP